MKPIHKDLITTGILITLLLIACLIPSKGCSEKDVPEPNMELMTPLERAERACEDSPYSDCVERTLRNMGEQYE
jgi:hypothetical protein